MRKTLLKPAVFLIAMAVLTVSVPELLHAQSSDVRALLDRMNRLEADLNSVQRKVFQGQSVPASSSSSGTTPSYTGSDEGIALLSARVDALEQEQRRVTGSTEEVNFRLDQLKSRLDKLILDIDYRLSEIERRLDGGNQSVVGQANPNAPQDQQANTLAAVPNSPAVTSQPVDPSRVAEGGELPQGTKLLGTLPASGAASGTAPTAGEAAGEAAASSVATLAPEEQYNLAMSLIRKDDYAGAEQAFVQFLEQNQQHTLAGNAQYWLGETYYVRGDYNNAASSFLNGYQNYPDSSKAADNLLKLGMTLGRMDQIEEACATFVQLDRQFDILPSRLKQIAAREKQKFNCP
ncbi:tol-pal system protein YbgF [Sneathiella glossodoripedis]|uniref:tol-pal system protein YbgF n=1 Tax=Sneathiella glossodoripedis TaxID=418853 RepID=UPI00131F16C3|nr:tol-pal system protein YbgF [Sneathiella glossodoripedis]